MSETDGKGTIAIDKFRNWYSSGHGLAYADIVLRSITVYAGAGKVELAIFEHGKPIFQALLSPEAATDLGRRLVEAAAVLDGAA